MKAIVIGAGLFGSLIALGLRRAGHDAVVIDDRRPLAGSIPAACLIKAEWCGKLPPGVYHDAMEFLKKNFLLHEVDFGFQGKATWVDPAGILVPELGIIRSTVKFLQYHRNRWQVHDKHGFFEADLVVVAAGAWSQVLVPDSKLNLVAKAGSAVLFPEVSGKPAFIKPWAPYKQIVGFDRKDGYWIGDGSAILQKNYTLSRERESVQRCLDAAPFPSLSHGRHKVLTGLRPYTDVNPCVCDQVKPRLWVATGARKNGTLLGAWCAQRIVGSL